MSEYQYRKKAAERSEPFQTPGGPPAGALWYGQCPDLITANNPTRGEGTRPLPPARLPEHETAFAMTAHKVQGSRFERAEVVPPPRDSRVLTRRLDRWAMPRYPPSWAVGAPKLAFDPALGRRDSAPGGTHAD